MRHQRPVYIYYGFTTANYCINEYSMLKYWTAVHLMILKIELMVCNILSNSVWRLRKTRKG